MKSFLFRAIGSVVCLAVYSVMCFGLLITVVDNSYTSSDVNIQDHSIPFEPDTFYVFTPNEGIVQYIGHDIDVIDTLNNR